MEQLELALDSAAKIIKNLQMRVCCCNGNVVRRDLREESVESSGLKYMMESGEEEEDFRTPPGGPDDNDP